MPRIQSEAVRASAHEDILVDLYTKFLSVRLTPDYRATQGEAQANWMMA